MCNIASNCHLRAKQVRLQLGKDASIARHGHISDPTGLVLPASGRPGYSINQDGTRCLQQPFGMSLSCRAAPCLADPPRVSVVTCALTLQDIGTKQSGLALSSMQSIWFGMERAMLAVCLRLYRPWPIQLSSLSHLQGLTTLNPSSPMTTMYTSCTGTSTFPVR